MIKICPYPWINHESGEIKKDYVVAKWRADACIFLFGVLTLPAGAIYSSAQVYSGSLTGVVTDSTGGVIPSREGHADRRRQRLLYNGVTGADGRGKRFGNNWNYVVDTLLGGWQTNGAWRFDDGLPIQLTLNGGQSLPTYGAQRPNLTGTLTRNNGSNWLNQYFADPQDAVVPAPLTVDKPRANSQGARSRNGDHGSLDLQTDSVEQDECAAAARDSPRSL